MKWLERTVAHERGALERARRRFIAEPSEKRLHDVRTKGRRLRSLLEDAAELVAADRLRRRAKRAAAATDVARDATVLFRLLERSVDPTERLDAAPLLELLQTRQAAATRCARRSLRRLRFAR